MPNLLDWLGGVAAEINPFDNGDNFNSYIKKRQQPQRPQPQPQQVVPQRIAPPQQLRPLGFTSPMPSPASVSRNSVTNQFNPLKALADISRPISQGGINGLADIGNAITNMAQHPVETATAVASGIQRVPAVVGDIDLQGRAVVGSLVDNLNPALTQEQRDINNLRRVQETEIVRNWLKSLKSLDGQSMIRQDDWNPTGDFVKDTGDLIGRSADVANSATTLINPTASFVKGAAGRTFMPVLKNTARDATFFGTLNGVQQGATTLGQTGDFGKAFADGTQAAGQAALMQGAMGLGGYAAGRGLSKATSTTKKATTATAKAVNESRPSVIAAQHPEIQQLDSHINMLQQQFDNEPNKLVRNQLNKAITVANNERRSVYSRALSQAKRAQEGGYAKIPNPDELFKKNAKNAYKVSDGQKYYTELSPAESDLKMPFTNDKYNELLHNKNHTDAVNQDFNKNLGYIKTLSNPDKIIKDAQSGRVNYVRELQGSNEGKVNRVGTKPVEQKGNQYLNTSFIQGGKRRNSKLLDGLAKPSSPVGDGASIPVLKSNSNVPQSKGNVNNYTKANKELKTAIDARINETNPELFHTEATGRTLSETGASIPSIHVDDLKRYFGHTEDFPAKYKRTTGRADLDELAREAGFDDVDNYVEAIQQELGTRSKGRENAQMLRDLRNDPTIIEEARQSLADEKARYGTPDTFEPSARDLREADKMNRPQVESTSRRVERALDPNDKLAYKNLSPLEKKLYQGEKAKQRLASRVSASSSMDAGTPKSRSRVQTALQSESPQATPQSGTSSSLKTGEISTSSKENQLSKTNQAVSETDTKALTAPDRSYVDNTTDVTERRGFTQSVKNSDEVSTQTKRKVSGEYNVRSTDKLALSADDFSRGNLQKVTDNVNERLDVKKGKITDQDVADSLAVAKRLDAQQRFDQSQAIYDKLAQHGTASGQTIQAFSLLKNRTPEGIKYQMIRDLKKAGVNLTDADQKRVGQLIDNVRKTKPDTDARNRALFETMDYVSRRVPNNMGDKLVNFWRAGLLTAPKTTGGNIIGNASEVAARELWANPVAIATDKFFSLFTGKRTKTMSKGTAAGFKEGAVKGWDYMKTGYDKRNVQSKWDAPRRVNYNNKVVDTYVNGVYRWMGTQDQPFYYGAKAAAAHDLAKADGMNLKMKGQELADYIEKAVSDENWKPQTFKTAKDVEQYARYAVYQNDTLLGSMAQGIKKAADKKGMRWLTDFILPFTQVPSSIAMRVIDRTPIGTARELASQIRRGSFDQRAMAEAIGNGSFGIPVVATGYALSQAGEITGDYPTDSKERKLWEEEGKQPYSIRIGDKWHSLNYIQPFGTILNIGHKINEQKKAGIGDGEAWLNAVTSAGQSVTDQSFLKGLNSVLSALNDPDRSFEQFVKQTAGSAVPNFIRSFAGAVDDKQRDTKGVNVLDSAAKSIQSSLPVLRQGLPEKQGMFGNTLERRDDAANSYLNPLRPSKVKNENDPLLKELRRLQDGGNGIVTTDFSSSSIKDVTLTDDQVRDLNKQVNSAVKPEWDKVIADPRYASLSDEDKNTVLKRIKDNIADGVKADFVTQNNLTSSGKYKASSSDPFATSKDGGGTYADKYQAAQSDWDKSSASWSSVKRTEKQKELRKLKVQKDYDNDTVDLYGWSKANIAEWLATDEEGVDKKKIAENLLKYDRALYDAGLVSSLKFKYGFASGSKSGKKGGKKGNGVTEGKAMVSLARQLNKLTTPKTTGSKSPAAGIKLPQLKKTALRKYTVKTAKVQKAAKPLKIKTSKA